LFPEANNADPGRRISDRGVAIDMAIWQKLFGKKTSAGAVTTSSPSTRPSTVGSESHYNLGNALYSKGDLDGAIREFREAIRIRQDLWEARNNLGAVLLVKGDLAAAIFEYRELVRLAPDFADGHTNLGNALYQKGDVAGAIAEYREATRLKPNSADNHYNLANALEKQGTDESAILEFREAIRLRPDRAETHFNLGYALARRGDLDGAIAEYREVLRLTPDDANAKENLRMVTSQKAEMEVKVFPKTTAADKSSFGPSESAAVGSAQVVKTRLEAGRRLFSEHRYNAALDEVIAALDIDPRNGEALDLAGTILYLCGGSDSQERIRPSVAEDPLLDGLFNQCSRCHRCWPGNPTLKGEGQRVVFNPVGGRCPKCQKVWCRGCAPGEVGLSCPECRVELEILTEPSGRKRGLRPAKRPDLTLRQVCIFKAPPKPRNATSYTTLVLDGLCPDAFHSDPEIYFHTGEEGVNEEAATQIAIARWRAKGIKVDFDHTFRESFTDADGGKGIMLTSYEPKQ
jgi:Flp pilus assembly protein TadD